MAIETSEIVGNRGKSRGSRRMRAYCHGCKHKQTLEPVRMNHSFHFIVSVLTLGLWLISWFALWLGIRRRPWRCKQCGRLQAGTSR